MSESTYGLQDFAKYKKVMLEKPAEAQWIPEIPSLALGAVIGSIITLIALRHTEAVPVPNLLEEAELIAEQIQSQSVKFEFYGLLKNR
jgi:hypothetical protein